MWPLSFISEADFTNHVKETIEKYGAKLESYDLEKFNSNIIDPIKMIFDKMVYQSSWQELIKNEIFRQRDKSANNDIGYFHQRIFEYMDGCTVPREGWDVIYKCPSGVKIYDGDNVETVHVIYVEMKNKHNTMNSASSQKTYMKAQHQILNNDDCAVFLVEAIAKTSQNIKWQATLDGNKVQHRRIRRVSMDQFYALVTGQEDAFFQMCMVLPKTIEKVVSHSQISVPNDTVVSELKNIASRKGGSMALAIYLLGFPDYRGFRNK